MRRDSNRAIATDHEGHELRVNDNMKEIDGEVNLCDRVACIAANVSAGSERTRSAYTSIVLRIPPQSRYHRERRCLCDSMSFTRVTGAEEQRAYETWR